MPKVLTSILLGSGRLTDYTNTLNSRGFMPALEREKFCTHKNKTLVIFKSLWVIIQTGFELHTIRVTRV